MQSYTPLLNWSCDLEEGGGETAMSINGHSADEPDALARRFQLENATSRGLSSAVVS